jgi:hypothetical protein
MTQPQQSPDVQRQRDFDAMYERTPPWDIARPQNAFLELAMGRLG